MSSCVCVGGAGRIPEWHSTADPWIEDFHLSEFSGNFGPKAEVFRSLSLPSLGTSVPPSRASLIPFICGFPLQSLLDRSKIIEPQGGEVGWGRREGDGRAVAGSIHLS